MAGRIGFEINLGNAREPADTRRRVGQPFRILVMADLSARHSRGLESVADLGERRCVTLDIDTFEAAFKRLSPALSSHAALGGAPLQFTSLEDFHPDQLYVRAAPFEQLRESRARLLDPATFEQEAARLTAISPATITGAASQPETTAPASPRRGSLLEGLIGAPARMPAFPGSSQTVVGNLVQRLVQPHIKPDLKPSAAPYLAAIDISLTDLMRSVLHEPDFQSLEATWRGVRRLVETLDLGDEIELNIVDISKDELLADLVASQGNPQRSAAHLLLARGGARGADASHWSLLVGHYTFGAEADDIALLTHLGIVASQAGAPFIGAAQPSLAGCHKLDEPTEPRTWAIEDADVDKNWSALRRSPVARWVGLAMPRILLRLPYGAKTDAVDSFAFEEFSPSTGHDAYLWGNPALACAEVMARVVADEDGDTAIGGAHEIGDLPAHVHDRDDGRALQPCAEYLLPIHVGEELQRRGIMPLLSYANRNAVRIPGVHSISEPAHALAGFD